MRVPTLKLIVLLILLSQIQSCENKKTSKTNEDPFVEGIKDSFPELTIESRDYIESSEKEPFKVTVTSDSTHLVVADRASYVIQLFNQTGTEELSKVGGEGRGPAEFNTISQIHIGHNEALYVLDILLKRITKFHIKNNELRYVTTFNLESAQNLSLRNVFVTKHGNFGVYLRIDNYENRKESFHLYKLDTEFRPDRHLLEMSGNEKLKLGKAIYVNKLLGQKTFWDLQGSWFYYVNSYTPLIKKYNLSTAEREEKKYFSLADRTNSEQRKKVLKDRMSAAIKRYPAIGEEIEESSVIPKFDNFQVRENQLFFSVYYAGGENHMMIHVDETTGEVHYIEVPNFFEYVSENNTMYGIESAEKRRPRIIVLKLNP